LYSNSFAGSDHPRFCCQLWFIELAVKKYNEVAGGVKIASRLADFDSTGLQNQKVANFVGV
jgi:hypothetical protein